ncbi:MAG: GNAT family N-acetyltransferase [Actinomycetota bacterium]
MLLETERLVLRLPTAADEDMRHHLEQWQRNGIGKFAVVRRADGAVLGRVGIQLLDPVTWDTVDGAAGRPELGWTLRPEHWGHGYATEAALAVRDWFVGEPLVSLIQPSNERSQAVARRLGASPGPVVRLADGPHVIWEHPSVKIRAR